jgi:hypothetical protein
VCVSLSSVFERERESACVRAFIFPLRKRDCMYYSIHRFCFDLKGGRVCWRDGGEGGHKGGREASREKERGGGGVRG